MSYCTTTEVGYLTGTTLSDTIVGGIITESDRQVDAKLALYGLSGGGDTCKSASLNLSVAGVLRRHQMDGTQPNSLGLGGISMSVDIESAIRTHTQRADVLIDEYARNTLKARAWMTMVRKVNR